MSAAGLRRSAIPLPLTVTVLCAATAASMFIRTPGLYALVIAVALVAPWRGRPERALLSVGLSPLSRQVLGGAVLAVAAVANLALGGQVDGHLRYGGDFHTYFVGAAVGLQHGWSHLFDPAAQAAAWQATPGAWYQFLPYLNTPPTAWLVAPLTPLHYDAAYAVFVAAMLTLACVTAWMLAPVGRRGLVLLLVACAASWDVVSSLASGQNAWITVVAVLACWRLVEADRRILAGVALGFIALRPNSSFLVPLALLVAGERRVFLAWVATSTVFAAVILASLGPQGVRQFADLALLIRRTHPASMQLTMQAVIGQPALAWALQVCLGLAAAVIGARRARGNTAMVVGAGLLASLLMSPYMHVQDYLAPLALLVVMVVHQRDQGAIVVLLLFLLVAPPGWTFADAWPALFITVELAWLGWLLVRGRDSQLVHRQPTKRPQTVQRSLST